MKLLNLIILILLISSCATVETGNKFQPIASIPEDKATLYIYRPDTYFNWGGWPEIYIDNQLNTSLLNNSHIICHVMPGEHKIKAEGSTWGTNWYPGPVEMEYTFSAGVSYYLRIRPIQTGSTEVQNTLTESALTNAALGVAIDLAVGSLPGWPTSITLMEMVDADTGMIEIQETYQLVESSNKKTEEAEPF